MCIRDRCYETIEKDLTDAINSNALPKTNEVGYVNLWAAKALQVRVYMTKDVYKRQLIS